MKLTFQKLLIAVSTAVLILFVGHLLMGKETLMNHINPVLTLFLLFPAAFVVLLLQQWLHNRRPTYTATATIVSRRTEPGRYMRSKSAGPFGGTSTINYIVTFRLSDGEELELLTGKEEYFILEEGLTGILEWQGTDFRYFESND